MSLSLFDFPANPAKNHLPYDGEVNYYGRIVNQPESDNYFNVLRSTIEWRPDQAVIFGKLIETKRKVAWYAENPFSYTYSNTTKYALPWTKELLELKQVIEEKSQETFNSCLLNLYHDGSEAMAWHSDGEKDLKKNGAIASVSFGAERKFGFKHKETKEKVYLELEHGSLLIMKGTTQTHWLHALSKSAKVKTARINLTFRTIVNI